MGGLAVGGAIGVLVPGVKFSYTVDHGESNALQVLRRNKLKRFSTFLDHVGKVFQKNVVMVHPHFVLPEDKSDNSLLSKCYFAQKVRLSPEAMAFGEDVVFQNALFSVVDSNLGALARSTFGFLPVATAALDFKTHRPILPNKDYFIFATVKKVEGRRVFIAAKVTDDEGGCVADFTSRFSRVDWVNAFSTR